VPPLRFDELNAANGNGGRALDTDALRDGVLASRERQRARNGEGRPNARLTTREIDRHCALSRRCSHLLREAHERLGLSARGTHRVLRIARTIADLDACEAITETHLAEAIQYRALDRDAS
jgi:magnesium chelatase family protein